MRKGSITKPVFKKIFAMRFLVWCVIFVGVAAIVLGNIYDYMSSKRREIIYSYRNNVVEAVRELSAAKPGSDEYKQRLIELKVSLAIYQSIPLVSQNDVDHLYTQMQ